MDQYLIPVEISFDSLRTCLDNYTADSVYVRLKHSSGGDEKLDEGLECRTLDFRKDDSGLYLSIDSSEVFTFTSKVDNHPAMIEYMRFEPTDDRVGRKVVLYEKIDPYDEGFPEPAHSKWRKVINCYLLEIGFKGRVDIEFHSWLNEPHEKYWKVVMPKQTRRTKAKKKK